MSDLDVKRARSKGVSASQIKSIDGCWEHLTEILGADLDVALVTYDLLEDYVVQRRATKAKGQSIRKELQALKRGMRIAKRKGWLPAVLDEWPELASDTPNEKLKGKLHPVEIVRAWLAAMAGNPLWWTAGLQAEVVARTNLRHEESRRLTWAWVEPSAPGSNVPATLRVPAEAAKNRKQRTIGLTPETLTALNAARVGKGWDEPLFPGDYKRARASALKAIGYPRNITLRDLRHCHATWGLHGSGDAAATQAAMGHADLRTTQLYQTATIERTTDVAVAVGRTLDGLAGGHTDGAQSRGRRRKIKGKAVEASGIEPLTCCVQSSARDLLDHASRCSPCLSVIEEVVSMYLDDGGCGHSPGHSAGRAS